MIRIGTQQMAFEFRGKNQGSMINFPGKLKQTISVISIYSNCSKFTIEKRQYTISLLLSRICTYMQPLPSTRVKSNHSILLYSMEAFEYKAIVSIDFVEC